MLQGVTGGEQQESGILSIQSVELLIPQHLSYIYIIYVKSYGEEIHFLFIHMYKVWE